MGSPQISNEMKQQDRAVLKSVSFNIPTSQDEETSKKRSGAEYRNCMLNKIFNKNMVSPDHVWAVIKHNNGTTFLEWRNGLTAEQTRMFTLAFKQLTRHIRSVDRNQQWGNAHARRLAQIPARHRLRHGLPFRRPNTRDWVHYFAQLPYSDILEITSAEAVESIQEALEVIGVIKTFKTNYGRCGMQVTPDNDIVPPGLVPPNNNS